MKVERSNANPFAQLDMCMVVTDPWHALVRLIYKYVIMFDRLQQRYFNLFEALMNYS